MADFSVYESFRFLFLHFVRSDLVHRANMTKEEVMSWFQLKLNRMPEAYDIYQVGFLFSI